MNKAFVDYFRCPEQFATFGSAGPQDQQQGPGYFTFGPGLTCFGRSDLAQCLKVTGALPDAFEATWKNGSTWVLPFNPSEIADNLRLERYVAPVARSGWRQLVRKLYYGLRPALPVWFRRHLQRAWLKGWHERPFPRWPVDRTVDQMFEKLMHLAVASSPQERVPFIWFWPDQQSSCAILTHDVEQAAGLEAVGELMDINDEFDFKGSFQIIPDARYVASATKIAEIKRRGFEVNVHDLKHDGHLYEDQGQFLASAERINQFALAFESDGFRAGMLYRNQEWFGAYRFSYDMSVPNVGHLDPQAGGCCTVMPYFVGDIVELPVTTTQDYSLFHVLETYSQDLWRRQIDQIMEQHGLISFIVHPDYLETPKARATYRALLASLCKLRAEDKLWVALPGDVDRWWRQRSAMSLVEEGGSWRVEGAGAERASVAYATLENMKLTYVFP